MTWPPRSTAAPGPRWTSLGSVAPPVVPARSARLLGLSPPTLRRVRSRVAGADAEAGQIMLLTLAFSVLALSLVLVVASASAVHLERKRLLALADAAALAAADAIDLDRFYGADPGAGVGPDVGAARGDAGVRGPAPALGAGELPGAVPLSDAGVRDAVVRHLAADPSAATFTGLVVLDPTGSPDGLRTEVTLGAVARPPFVPWGLVRWTDGIPVRAHSSALAR